MEYKENMLCYEDYYKLRESVDWLNLSEQQAQKALNRSLYTVIAVENNQTIGMGRLIGDGLYYMIVDIIVHPAYQKNGVGSQIISMIIKYVDDETPINGRSSIQLIAEKGKETFYQNMGFKLIPNDFCGSGMRKVNHK